ncbi:MAG: DNA primase [Coriobacteriia bacterium]|nr:DNA primase [Coriobacteriia bacterium]
MRYSEEDIAKVKEATDLVALVRSHTDLRLKGRDWWACCPFHKEKTPSFKVSPDGGFWHCFGCGESGDAFGFIMRTENMSFPEAVLFLADRAHIEIRKDPRAIAAAGQRQRLHTICTDTADYYLNYLRTSKSTHAAAARDYLSKRGFGSDTAIQWRLGFAPGNHLLVQHLRSKGHRDDDMVAANVAVRRSSGVGDRFFERIIFPIADMQGRIIAFGGRVIDDHEPKYLNSSETPLFSKRRNLYGIDLAKSSMHESRMVLVVEGYTDVIALHKAGHCAVVATLGTALTAEHVKMLSRTVNRIVYVFDGDQAGMRAADKAAEHIDRSLSPEFAATPVTLDVVCLPTGTDPADLMDSSEGQAQFTQLLAEATPLIEFAIKRKMDKWDLHRPEERQRALNDSLTVLLPLKGTMLARHYAEYIADCISRSGDTITEKQVLDALEQTRDRPPVAAEAEGAEAEQSTYAAGTTAGSAVAGLDELPSLSVTELIERELLALVLLSSGARGYVLESVQGVPFSHPLYRAAYEQLQRLATEAGGVAAGDVLSELDELVPGVAQLVQAYSFEDAGEDARVLADNVLFRLRESALERKIRLIRSDLQKGDDTKALLEDLAQASQELHQIRAQRFQ